MHICFKLSKFTKLIIIQADNLQLAHIGASWTEGGKWKGGKFSILGASNEKSIFFQSYSL